MHSCFWLYQHHDTFVSTNPDITRLPMEGQTHIHCLAAGHNLVTFIQLSVTIQRLTVRNSCCQREYKKCSNYSNIVCNLMHITLEFKNWRGSLNSWLVCTVPNHFNSARGPSPSASTCTSPHAATTYYVLQSQSLKRAALPISFKVSLFIYSVYISSLRGSYSERPQPSCFSKREKFPSIHNSNLRTSIKTTP